MEWVVVNRPELTYPADLYLEGSDHTVVGLTHHLSHLLPTMRSTLQTNLVTRFALDGKGEKMSKSEILLLQAMLKNNSV